MRIAARFAGMPRLGCKTRPILRGNQPTPRTTPPRRQMARSVHSSRAMDPMQVTEAEPHGNGRRPDRGGLWVVPAALLIVTTVIAWLSVAALLIGSLVEWAASFGKPGIVVAISAVVVPLVTWQVRRHLQPHESSGAAAPRERRRPELGRLESSPQN